MSVWLLIVDLGDARAVDGLNPDLGSLGKISAETHAAGVTIFGQMKDGPAHLHVRRLHPPSEFPKILFAVAATPALPHI